MQQQWPQLSAADKAQCVPAATVGGTPSYTELLTCLEMARDLRQMHGKGQPTTTGQGREVAEKLAALRSAHAAPAATDAVFRRQHRTAVVEIVGLAEAAHSRQRGLALLQVTK